MIQKFEFWTRQPDGTVSGTTALLQQVTGLINSGFDHFMPLLLSYDDYIRWDDTNHTDKPSGKINLVSGQSDYKITTDGNSLDILNFAKVRVLQSSTATNYVELEKMTLDDERVADAISPNPSITGVPEYWLENGNKIFLYPAPNYSATNGIQLFFERKQKVFVYTDTTREPGIPSPFHELPVLYGALEWNSVNRANDISLLNSIKQLIAEKRHDIERIISLRNPTRRKLTPKLTPFI